MDGKDSKQNAHDLELTHSGHERSAVANSFIKKSTVLKRSFTWEKIKPYVYLLPAVLFVAILFIYPAIYTFVISFTKWDGINPAQFVGLKNYIHIFTDSTLLFSSLNTLIWVVASLILPVGLGLLFAIGINRIKWSGIHKSAIFLPMAISATATGVIWARLLSANGIPLLLQKIGLVSSAPDWLLTPYANTLAMIGTHTWQSTGMNMVLFLVGLQAIPKEVLEAGMIDGASGWKLFRHITLPLLKPMTIVVVLMSVVGSVKIFDIIWVMTQGGPYGTSATYAVSMYTQSFKLSHYGVGSSMAILLSIIVIIFSWKFLKVALKGGNS